MRKKGDCERTKKKKKKIFEKKLPAIKIESNYTLPFFGLFLLREEVKKQQQHKRIDLGGNKKDFVWQQRRSTWPRRKISGWNIETNKASKNNDKNTNQRNVIESKKKSNKVFLFQTSESIFYIQSAFEFQFIWLIAHHLKKNKRRGEVDRNYHLRQVLLVFSPPVESILKTRKDPSQRAHHPWPPLLQIPSKSKQTKKT